MKKMLAITILSFFLCASAEASDRLKVVVFGDSLTSGYQLQPEEAFSVKLQKKLREIGFETIDVVNMSESGGSSARGLERVSDLLLAKPDVVVLAFGVNDVLGGVDPGALYQNVAYIAAQLQQQRVYTILMGIKPPRALGSDYERRLQEYYYAIAKNYGLSFYANALEGISENAKLTVADGYRPNAQGVDIMVEGMYRLVDAGLRWRISVIQYQNQSR